MNSKNKWLGLAAILPSVAMNFLDQTILPVALPAIRESLEASATQLQWTVNSYLLALTTFLLAAGKWGDRIGLRNAFSIGISLFGISSALCALSPNIACLIAARSLQGLGAAIMLPAQTALVALLFPPHQRGRATGLIVSIGSLFLVLGPFLGGYLTQILSWHWIFLINLPIAILGIGMIFLFLPHVQPTNASIDRLGFLLFLSMIVPLIVFLMNAESWGWTSFKALLCASISAVSCILLLQREKTSPRPFLELSLFKNPLYTASCITMFAIQFIFMATVFQTIYFEDILGYSPTKTGLLISVSGAPILFSSPVAGYLSDKFGSKVPIAIGHLLLIFYFFWFSFFSLPSLTQLLIPLLAFGIGVNFIFTPSVSTVMSSVCQKKLGIAFGMLFTCRMGAATLGLSAIHAAILSILNKKSPILGVRQATIMSFSWVCFGLGCLVILAFAGSYLLHSRKSKHKCPDLPAEGWD